MSEKAKQHTILNTFLSCRDSLARYILKMSVKQEDVDDILQEAFLRVYNEDKKKQIRSPKDYLFIVSRNLIYKGLKHQSKEIATDVDDYLLGHDDKQTEIELHKQRKFKAFNDALMTLPEKNRRAILLRKYYGLSHKEISQKLGVSVSSVEKYISKGIKQCGDILAGQGYEAQNIGGESKGKNSATVKERSK
ncbi:RNA polymerase sigma factor [Thalassotalea fonticola]|uniref:RNA polymerase sigma factor n=1 Tax=Thalassotalea fonticola TaxID=3065649 RepID=A0ABZ0GTG8_9GAMM|nr:RNA polymerase sigma factor [Colwelliaceae bacterium S1-1]